MYVRPLTDAERTRLVEGLRLSNAFVLLIQGEKAACGAMEEQFPGVLTACVKRALSRDFCTGLDPNSAHRLTAEKVGEQREVAFHEAAPIQHKPTHSMTISIRLASVEGAESVAKQPGVKRVDEYTVECRVERYAAWSRGSMAPGWTCNLDRCREA